MLEPLSGRDARRSSGDADAEDRRLVDDLRLADDLRFAIDLAREAGRLLTARSTQVGDVGFKGAKDIVTEVDHLAEALILTALRAHGPGDAILAEETGGHDGAGEPPTSGRGRTWIVDPIDGTINYANGIPFYCVSLALVVDGVPAIGVIHDPVRGETFAAEGGGPATLDGQPVEASRKEHLKDCVVSLSLSGRSVARRARAIQRAVRVSRSMGSAALALAYVGCGRFDAFIQEGGLSVWDIAAAGLIAERGGARLTDGAGGPWFRLAGGPKSIGLVAAPEHLQPTFIRLVRGAEPEPGQG